ncbi:MAG: CDP-diacylglycerol--serine O-phosphatidyltransferase, partial [Acidobacteriota bacterium]
MRFDPDRRRFSRPRGRRARRGIYLLPSLLTVGNLFAGYWCIVVAERGEFGLAGLLLIVAGILDNLDGRVARVTGTATAFGLQFDSLADAVSFGVAPAFMVYMWGMQPLGRLGWLGSFLFVVCGAMRLARYNIQVLPDKRFFAGLPIPAAALVIATLTFYRPRPILDQPLAAAVLILVLTLSGLMVSRLRYPSFKGLDGKAGRHSFLRVALLALLLA